jgi:uncharacterized metal-binding protein YceD (DUF177 family)
MCEALKIYVHRLKEGHKEKIQATLLASDLSIQDEQDLSFLSPITVSMEAYLAEEHLILHLDIDTQITLPCAICNEKFTIPLTIKNLYLSPSLAEMSGAIFDTAAEIREALLLQIPHFFECNKGKCPERQFVSPYLKKASPTASPHSDEGINFPFSELSNL